MPVKNEKWTEDLYLYRMKPAPPKMEDFQEYIALYFAEKDEKYLGWFFHYYEPRLIIVDEPAEVFFVLFSTV